MGQIRALVQGHLLLLAIAYVATEVYAIKVQNGAADPNRSGSVVRAPEKTLVVKGKLFYDLTQ